MQIQAISYGLKNHRILKKQNNNKATANINNKTYEHITYYQILNNNISFTSSISPQKKLIETCKNMTYENYNAAADNRAKGIFQIDLHSHSNHSDGWANVKTILDQAAKYGDELYAKTGKPFTFALTDHDDVWGVKEALKYIESDKAKFKNVNFIPGVELSFSFVSGNDIKSGEVLAYFIDPDSKEMKMIVENVRKNRNEMINNFIEVLGDGYNRKELERYFIDGDETFAYNLHYRLRNYAQIKTRINKIAKEYNVSADELYRNLMNGYVFGRVYRVQKPHTTPEGLDDFLKKNSIETHTDLIDEGVEDICHLFYPGLIDNKIVSVTENSFEKILKILGRDDRILLGFAHPYFTAKQMKDFRKGFDNLLKIANGKIVFSENYHQSYPQSILNSDKEREYLGEVNEFLLSRNLIPIGGRDNHSPNFL